MLAFLSPRRTSCEYEMSFPFQQYDYSAESTPNAFTWPELEQDSLVPTSATTPNQPASISPPALQQPIQALPHSPTENVQFQQHQHHQQQEQPQQQPLQLQQQEPHQIQAVFEPPQTNFVEDRFQPSQYHFDVIDESHFLRQQSGSHVGRPGTGATTSCRPPLRVEVDDVRPAGRNTSESAPSAGPARVPHGRPHTQTSHPYRRPETASGKRSVSASTSGQILRPSSARQERVVSEQQHARLLPSSEREPPRSQLHGSVVGVGSAHPAPMPTVGVGSTSVSCPAISIWRVNQSYNSQQNQIQRVVSGGSSAETAPTANTSPAEVKASTPVSINTPLVPMVQLPAQGHQAQPQTVQRAAETKRYIIRTDVHYDAEKNLMTVMFELPGLKKTDLRMRLSVCPYSRVRQLTISGRIKPTLSETGFTIKERKFGDFHRTVIVPYGTQPADVDASMEDGILTLRIPGGTPAPREDAQDVLIR